jgi:demethylmenaquinone methyltransferase/2-methoxy-6-polyprenyl-1,4-benzoquinol methylase
MSSPAASGAASAPSPRKRHALDLFRGLPGRYDTLSAALSLGQDPRWRRALVDALAPRAGEHVLDVATGTGMVAAELLGRADCTVFGVDQSAEMLAVARARFGDRVRLVEGQAEALPFGDGTFDAVSFTYLLRYVDDVPATLRELARVLRAGGRIASLEFGVPPWPPARAAWRVYTGLLLPALGAVASRDWYEVGRFLGPNIRDFYARHPVPSLVADWQAAGFEDVRVRRMSLGGGIVMSARRPDSAAAG